MINKLKPHTLAQTLFPPTTLKKAVNKLGFVQIDPIKSPATAHDLVLRHRVNDYHVKDIEREYSKLNLEEDYLFAHGYMTQDIFNLLHPRTPAKLDKFDQQVLETIQTLDEIYPKDLEKHFEKKSEINWWGGNSNATRMALDRLHYYGYVRVTGRQSGFRIYKAFTPTQLEMTNEERLSKIVMSIVNIMAPVTTKTLQQSMHRIHRHFGQTRPIINNLLKTGQLEQQTIDGLTYIWSPNNLPKMTDHVGVKFLSPFDPVVRDRFRFQHLWGWNYQFEAYVPAAKRIRGYYAMPLLYNNDVIGWANVKNINGELNVDLGFIKERPKSKEFEKQLEEEILKMKIFLNLV